MKKILFIETNLFFHDVFEASKELNYWVILGRNSVQSPPNKNIDEFVYFKNINYESILQYVKKNRVDFVITFKDKYITLVSKINSHINKDHLYYNYNLSVLCKNKYLLRKKLDGSDFNTHYSLIDTENFIWNQFDSKLGYIIKPLMGFSSIGVEYVTNKNNIKHTVNRNIPTLKELNKDELYLGDSNYDKAKKNFLIESYISGDEYGIDILVENKKILFTGISSKEKMPPPYFEEISYCFPAQLKREKKKAITNAIEKIVKIIGLKNGVAHIEIIHSKEKITVIDIGLRFGGGGLVNTFIKNSYGIELARYYIYLLLEKNKQRSSFLKKTKNNVSILFLYQIGEGGKIQSMPKPAKEIYGYKLFKSLNFVKKGDITTKYPQFSGHTGCALYSSPYRPNDSYKNSEQLIKYSLIKSVLIYE